MKGGRHLKKAAEKKRIDYSRIERFLPDLQFGLSDEQVQRRTETGLINGETEIKTRSVGKIIRDNIFTPFNILNMILAALVIAVGSFKNVLFLNIILINIVIGSFQEIRAKKTIDRLSLISTPKATVIRGGRQQAIDVSRIVLDDLLILSPGNQICADCILMEGECEVNESLITGESDPVVKKPGDTLLSGSFISSGSCRARVDHIGADNYASSISEKAKYEKKPNSDILRSMNRIVKTIGFMIIPVGLLLMYKELFLLHSSFRDAVISVVAALIGMIPEGLMLLISVVFAVGVIRLSSHNTLVQELYSIETLARVDTLCLDKTGTITEGAMQVDEIVPLKGQEKDYPPVLAALMKALPDRNPTSDAIAEKFGKESPWQALHTVPFSSARKWSGASFGTQGTYVLGAGEFVLGSAYEEIRSRAEAFSAKGQRVLVLAHSDHEFSDKELPLLLEPAALVVLSDKIRPSARLTLEYFADQGVDVKVISGDNPVTVAHVAGKAGLEKADSFVDASTLHTKEEIWQAASRYTVFGRVTPQQKLEFVKALKSEGHTVAMTGDGVNDVLALKEADCSIAMASGSDAARTVSQLVLLDSDFASMPLIVKEGRRSINNLQRSASLYLVKTVFYSLMAVFFIFVSLSYPFQPIQLTLMSAMTIGAPSFFLALEPNKERVKGSFIKNVLKKSLPASLTMMLNIALLTAITMFFRFGDEQFSTLCVLLTSFTGFLMLLRVCSPLNTVRTALFSTMAVGFVLAALLFSEFFGLAHLTISMVLVLIPTLTFAAASISVLEKVLTAIFNHSAKRGKKKKWKSSPARYAARR